MKKKIPNDTSTFHYHNANPKNKWTTDCVVRAISTVTGKSWEAVLKELTEFAIHYGQMVNDPILYSKYLDKLGFVKMNQPKRDNGFKYTGYTFCRKNPDITCIAHIGGHHLVAIVEGKVWDIWDSTDGCIGNYWIKMKR